MCWLLCMSIFMLKWLSTWLKFLPHWQLPFTLLSQVVNNCPTNLSEPFCTFNINPFHHYFANDVNSPFKTCHKWSSSTPFVWHPSVTRMGIVGWKFGGCCMFHHLPHCKLGACGHWDNTDIATNITPFLTFIQLFLDQSIWYVFVS